MHATGTVQSEDALMHNVIAWMQAGRSNSYKTMSRRERYLTAIDRDGNGVCICRLLQLRAKTHLVTGVRLYRRKEPGMLQNACAR